MTNIIPTCVKEFLSTFTDSWLEEPSWKRERICHVVSVCFLLPVTVAPISSLPLHYCCVCLLHAPLLAMFSTSPIILTSMTVYRAIGETMLLSKMFPRQTARLNYLLSVVVIVVFLTMLSVTIIQNAFCNNNKKRQVAALGSFFKRCWTWQVMGHFVDVGSCALSSVAYWD